MSFGLKFVSIVSIAGVLAWAASAAPLQPSGSAQSPGAGYGYGADKVTLCHVPPGNPDNAHTITVGAPAVPAHLAHGDTLGPCPETLSAAEESATEESPTGETKKQKPEKGASAGTQEKSNNGNGGGNGNAGGNGNGDGNGNGNGKNK